MTDNNCRYLTESEISEVLRIQLQDTKLDLTAARARIAELEDWQSRALDELLDYEGMCEHLMKDGAKQMLRQLIEEATR